MDSDADSDHIHIKPPPFFLLDDQHECDAERDLWVAGLVLLAGGDAQGPKQRHD